MTKPGGRLTPDLLALLVVLLAVLFAQQKLSNGITSDGALYFAHLRSIVFDHDLEIAPEIDALHQPQRPHHVVPIGPAIVWAPAYLAVAAVDRLGGATGAWTRASGIDLGLTAWYVQAAALSSFLMMAAGLIALHLRVRREFGPSIAITTSVLTLGATTLAWYVIFEPSMTHAVSFGCVAMALVLSERWLVDRKPTWRQGLMLGAWFSLVILVRPEDGVFLLFPAMAIAFAPVWRAALLPERLRAAGAMLLGAAPLLVLQGAALAWLMSTNTFSLLAGDEAYLTFFDARFFDVLFSSRHGLMSWTPIVWVALIGTIAYAKRRPIWGIPAIVAFLILVWTNGSAHDWSGGWAYGGRRFTSVLAAFAPGTATAIFAIYRRPLWLITPVAACVIGWNALLMTQYQRQLIPRDESLRFDALVRQQANLLLKPPFFYPFAFPANVLFAWREGLPVDRYDLLGSEPLRREMYLPLSDWGERFLLDGWADGANDASGSAHFLAAQSGTILVPLDVPPGTSFGIDLEARAAGAPAGGSTALDLAVNGRSLGSLPLVLNAAKPSRHDFVVPPGVKVWRRGYNRVTISRPLGAAPSITFIVYALRASATKP